MVNFSSKKLYHIQIFIVAFLGILLVNQLSALFPLQFDTTEEKRYTLHPSVKNVLRNLQEPVTIEVFLDGELPANFRRFQTAIRRTLEQFSLYAGNNIQFSFTDPSIAASNQARNQFYRSLIDKGIQPSNIAYTRDGEKTEKLIFPGVSVIYRGNEQGVTLLKGNRAMSIEEMLNQSVEGLEYELANAIKQLQSSNRKKIGFIVGHDEPDTSELAGFTNAILARYDLFRISLPERSTKLIGYDGIIIGKPASRFNEKEKYLLDQYIMNGGRLMVFVDALSVNMNEAEGEGTIAFPYELNIEDMLFKYGVRINRDYVADVNCGNTPVITGNIGNQPRIEMLPWPYWPVITNYAKHPVVRNLDATWFRGTSTIDTVKAGGILKTPLMFTSDYTKVFTPPVRISYNDLQDKLRPESFQSGPKALAYLLEGKFTSLYKNRFPPRGIDHKEFREESLDTKIIVVSDGDFIRNDFNPENDNPLPMGMDAYSQTTYANEDFLINALDYLVDEDGLMLARNREVKIRPLNKVAIQTTGNTWKWVNMILPVVLIIIFGIIKGIMRKRKFGKI